MSRVTLLFIAGGLLAGLRASAQVNVPASATMATSPGTDIVVSTDSDLTNNSSADFSNSNLVVDLVGSKQNITGNWVMNALSLSQSGSKDFTGNITITNKLTFLQGILRGSSASDKFLFTGDAGGLTGASANSYFDCSLGASFYSKGSGTRLFPVGNTFSAVPTYTPASLQSISDETGLRVVAAGASLIPDTTQVSIIDDTRYWEITTDVANVNGRVTLNLTGIDLVGTGGLSVIQSDAVGSNAKSLGSSSSSLTDVTSASKVTEPILTLGLSKKVNLRVHDLITPFGSAGVNDKLYIENIDKFDFNHVTLLDRWGAHVKEWTNFTNDTSYDFTKLGPGNYIVVVEYGNAGEGAHVVQQMVTVLKTN